MSGAVFGLNAIFSIVGYVVAVVILSAILDKDMGASEFCQYKYFVMCSMLFFGWIGSLCGGFFGSVCGVIAYFVSFIWERMAARQNECLMVFTYGSVLAVACGLLGRIV